MSLAVLLGCPRCRKALSFIHELSFFSFVFLYINPPRSAAVQRMATTRTPEIQCLISAVSRSVYERKIHYYYYYYY